MNGLISIKRALTLLTLLRTQRLAPEERERIDSAIEQLTRAQVDPGYRRWLHTPRRVRAIMKRLEETR